MPPAPEPRRRSCGAGRLLRAALCALAVCAAAPEGAACPQAPQSAPADPAPVEHPDLARVRDLGKAGKFPEAEELARRTLGQAERDHGVESGEAAAALEVLVGILLQARKAGSPEAEELAVRLVALREKLSGPDSLEVAASVANLGLVLRARARLAEAESAVQRSVAIREARLGPDHPQVARALSQLARIRIDAGKLDAAETDVARAMAIFEREGVPEYPDLDDVLSNQAILLYMRGDVLGGVEVFERVLGIRETALGPEHPAVTRAVMNLGTALREAGRFAEARTYLERALAADEARLGPDHPSVGMDLHNLGDLDVEMGDLISARARFERASAIRASALGEDSVQLADSLTLLSDVHLRLGDWAGARPLAERALRIYEKAHGPDHFRVAETSRLLADIVLAAGDYQQARLRYERSITIVENSLGPESPAVASILDALASAMRKAGQYSEALPVQERAQRIIEKTQGPEDRQTGKVAINMAILYLELGRTEEARAQSARAVSILERALPAPHPSIAHALGVHALTLAESSQKEAALDAALRAEAMGREFQDLVSRTLPERQALALAADRTSGLDVALALTAESTGDPVVAARAWDALIRSRALVLDEMAARRRAIAETGDAEAGRLEEAYVAASRDLANLLVKAADAPSKSEIRASIEAAVAACDQAESALAARSAQFRGYRAGRNAGLKDITAARPEGSSFVAYALYRGRRPESKEKSYLAFVLPPDQESPIVVPLGAAEEIDALVDHWRGRVMSAVDPAGADPGVEKACRLAGADLRRRVWDPVAAHLGEATRILVVPDGALNAVNIIALPGERSDYLVERLPPLQYLSAERDLVAFATRRTSGEGLLVVGGPAYDAAPWAPAPKVGRTSKAGAVSTAAASPVAFRGPLTECEGFRSLSFQSLPGSATEAREIERLWRDRNVVRVADAAATETAFRSMAPGRSVLHLATHGFALGPECPSALEGRELGDNPLRLSGLALAGANRRRQAGPDQDDGILTAEEIAALNLSGVEWAVLSACDTGRGAIQAGEGVLGLRRAFQIAGARTVILSLWPVEDRTARSWMRRLYEGRRVRGLDTAAATREASLGLLKERRAREQSTHPVFWAGFVAAGDWR